MFFTHAQQHKPTLTLNLRISYNDKIKSLNLTEHGARQCLSAPLALSEQAKFGSLYFLFIFFFFSAPLFASHSISFAELLKKKSGPLASCTVHKIK